MCDEYSVEDGLAPGEKINLFQGAKGVVVESKIESKVYGGMEVLLGWRRGGKWGR